MPLEHEVAKILKRQRLYVAGDWSYHRISETGVEKEWSVDLRAIASPKIEQAGKSCLTDILVECKYRRNGVTWLFLPHPGNERSSSHSPIQGIDHFAPWFIRAWDWDESNELSVCYKGFEVGFGASEGGRQPDDSSEKSKRAGQKTLDSQIRHGISQLQFALPSLVLFRVRGSAYRDINDVLPFFFAPILVTTAELVVAHKGFDRDAVEAATQPTDLGTVVPSLILNHEPGPDFARHAQRQLAELTQLASLRTIKAIEEFRKNAGDLEIELPSWLALRIQQDGGNASALSEFSNFLVCNINHFETTLQSVLRSILISARSISKEPVMKWQ